MAERVEDRGGRDIPNVVDADNALKNIDSYACSWPSIHIHVFLLRSCCQSQAAVQIPLKMHYCFNI